MQGTPTTRRRLHAAAGSARILGRVLLHLLVQPDPRGERAGRRRARHRHRDDAARARRTAAEGDCRSSRPGRARRKTVHEACAIAADVLERNTPPTSRSRCSICSTQTANARLDGSRGCSGRFRPPTRVSVSRRRIGARGRSRRSLRTGEARRRRCSRHSPTPSRQRPARAFVLPIIEQASGGAVGHLVAGLSPRLMFDDAYRDFLTWLRRRSAPRWPARARSKRPRRAPRRWRSSIARRPRSSPTSATSSARR